MTSIALFAMSACAAFLATGCGGQKPPAKETSVDLSQSTDIFDGSAAAAPMANPTAVVAVVNGENVTQADVQNEAMMMLSRMRGRVPPERLSQMRGEIEAQSRDAVITKKLLDKAVKDEQISVSDAELDEAIAKFKENTQPGVTLEDLLAGNNMTMDEFRKSLSNDLRINKLIEAHITNAAQPTDAELQAYYSEHKEQFLKPESVTASHVLISIAEGDTDEQKLAKKARAEDLRAKLAAGEDFAKCASENSDCPSKAQGGNLGAFRRGQMVKPFEDAAFSQKKDEIGPVVETQFGYHIIKVTEHEEAKEIPLEEVKDKLSQFLISQKKQQAAQEYITDLRGRASISFPGQDASQTMPSGS
jgi:peptidyl-prolyl cis-trans isomerase C